MPFFFLTFYCTIVNNEKLSSCFLIKIANVSDSFPFLIVQFV